jgi:ankyrin repeat protein
MTSSFLDDNPVVLYQHPFTHDGTVKCPIHRHGSILIVVVIALIMVVCAYFVYDSMIQSARDAGKKDISEGGGKVLKKFVEDDVEGMSKAIGEETRQKELFKAVTENRVEDVEALLQFDLELHRRNSSGATVLHRAVADNSVDIVRLLVQHKAPVNIVDNNGSTPLHTALSRRPANFEIVQLLLAEDSSQINSQSTNGMTPLLLAVQGGSGDCVEFLIGSGADYTLKNKAGQTPLAMAQLANNTRIIELLTSAGATK